MMRIDYASLTAGVSQDAEKVTQRCSRIAKRLNVMGPAEAKTYPLASD